MSVGGKGLCLPTTMQQKGLCKIIIIESKTAFIDRYATWFPERQEVEDMILKLGWNSILTVRQASFVPPLTEHCIKNKEFLTICIDLTRSKEDLWADVRQTTRNNIRRGMKCADAIQINVNQPECNDDFLNLYNQFVRAKGHTRPMALRSFETLRPLTDVFIVYYQERPIVGHMLLKDVNLGRVRSLYLGSARLKSKELGDVCGILSRYLHWHEIEYYKNNGFLIYDLGGIPSLNHPRAVFKQSFGGTVVTEYDCTYARLVGKLALKARDLLRRSS